MKKTQAHPEQHGFTLLELLVVVAIIGMLAALVGPRVFGHVSKSEITTAKAQIESFSRALDAYRLDVGSYPDAAQGLQALRTAPAGLKRWNGPYLLKDIPVDPWGHAYQYRKPGTRGEYDILSLGRDGVPGGSGDDADIIAP
ncbi:type II secretion system major pseudopilin GspG [Niveibacterium sp. 24ML]|uniref:type II secretion system major pseudopilin GspG n=1 Tax=Niveibacterium sp. 24ML TaxID=2985512 RepID=UPI002270F1B9|nr:type II secretion system major pseudopilin GspG [Niveibacterium sp. 24ML]MCX9155713.1 type II secretion system major pseudopilin GspG [Niveibacterium sp. 24ML]